MASAPSKSAKKPFRPSREKRWPRLRRKEKRSFVRTKRTLTSTSTQMMRMMKNGAWENRRVAVSTTCTTRPSTKSTR